MITAETIPVPDRYQNGIYNSKRKKFQRVKSVSSPNLLETALCTDERYFSIDHSSVLDTTRCLKKYGVWYLNNLIFTGNIGYYVQVGAYKKSIFLIRF